MLISSGVEPVVEHLAAGPDEQLLLGQVADHFLHEERIALGLAVDCLGQAPGHVIMGDALQHPADFVGIQARVGARGRRWMTRLQLGQGGGEGMRPVHLDVTVGAHDQQSGTASDCGTT